MTDQPKRDLDPFARYCTNCGGQTQEECRANSCFFVATRPTAERRLKLSDFDDQQGRAVPTYYSHALAGEVDLSEDLDRLTAAGLLKELADITPASKTLLAALRSARSVSAVADWEYKNLRAVSSLS